MRQVRMNDVVLRPPPLSRYPIPTRGGPVAGLSRRQLSGSPAVMGPV